MNKKLTEKFFEIAKWLNEQIAEQKSALPKEAPKSSSVEEKKDSKKSDGSSTGDSSLATSSGSDGALVFDD